MYGDIKQTASQRLRELAGVEQLQQRRDDLEAQAKLTREKLKQSRANLRQMVSSRGSMVLLADATDRQVPEFWQEVDQEQANINQFKLSLSHLEEALDNIREKLRQSPSEDIRKLQNRMDEVEQKIRELTLEQGANQQQIKSGETQIEGLARQIEKHRMSENRQEQVQRRITATEDAIALDGGKPDFKLVLHWRDYRSHPGVKQGQIRRADA